MKLVTGEELAMEPQSRALVLVKCPLCKKKVNPEWLIPSQIAVVRKGTRRMRFIPTTLAECCAREFIEEAP